MELWYWLTSVDNGTDWIDGEATTLSELKSYGAVMVHVREDEWRETVINGHTCYVAHTMSARGEYGLTFTLVPVESGLGERWVPKPLDN